MLASRFATRAALGPNLPSSLSYVQSALFIGSGYFSASFHKSLYQHRLG